MKISLKKKPIIAFIVILAVLLAILAAYLTPNGQNEGTGVTPTNSGGKNQTEIDTPHMLQVAEINTNNPTQKNIIFDKDSLTGQLLYIPLNKLIDQGNITRKLAITNQNTLKPVEYTIILTAAEKPTSSDILDEINCVVVYDEGKYAAEPWNIVLSGVLEGGGTDTYYLEFAATKPSLTANPTQTPKPSPAQPGQLTFDIHVLTHYKEKYTHYISSPEHFSCLLDDEKAPELQSGADIYLLKNITVDLDSHDNQAGNKPQSAQATLAASKLFNLELNGFVLKLTNGAVAINSQDQGTMKIGSRKNGGALQHEGFYINAPNAAVLWDEKCCPVSDAYLEYSVNVESFNGKTFPGKILGGKGKNRLLSLSFEKSKNKEIKADIKCRVMGNLVRAEIPYHVDFSKLDKLMPTMETDGGTVTIEFREPGQDAASIEFDYYREAIITVTDDDNKSMKYLLRAELKYNRLPCVFISTEGGQAINSKTEYINGYIKIIGSSQVDYGYPLEKTPVKIRGRGNTTWEWDKKPYKLKFNESVSLLGLPANKDWVLLANYSDKTLIRNHIAYEAAKKLNGMDFNPSTLLVDLFINGKYQGVYSLGEQIEVAGHRVNIEKEGTEADTGFLLEVGGKDDGDVLNWDYFHVDGLKFIAIKSPKEEIRSREQVDFIIKYITDTDKAIRLGRNIEEYIDINSFVDWFIIHELFYNTDSGFRRSCFMHKDKGGKLKMGPVWDFDIAMGNAFSTYQGWATADNDYVKTTWASYLLKNPAFTEPLKARWNDVKKMLLASIMENIDYCYEIIHDSQVENFRVWDILNKKVGFNPSKVVAANSYEKQIQYLKDYINNRYKWLDKAINNL